MDRFIIFHDVDRAELTVSIKDLDGKKTKEAIIEILKKYKHLDIVNNLNDLVTTIK
jgi:hypothetical protein